MSFASAAQPPTGGRDLPALSTPVPGPASRAWLARFAAVAAPMGPRAAWPTVVEGSGEPDAGGVGTIVYREGIGANVIDVDGNRFVDLAAGFGSLLLGHRPARVAAALEAQAARLWQSLGDLHPSDVKIRLLERLALRAGVGQGRGMLGQSGADALSAPRRRPCCTRARPAWWRLPALITASRMGRSRCAGCARVTARRSRRSSTRR